MVNIRLFACSRERWGFTVAGISCSFSSRMVVHLWGEEGGDSFGARGVEHEAGDWSEDPWDELWFGSDARDGEGQGRHGQFYGLIFRIYMQKCTSILSRRSCRYAHFHLMEVGADGEYCSPLTFLSVACIKTFRFMEDFHRFVRMSKVAEGCQHRPDVGGCCFVAVACR